MYIGDRFKRAGQYLQYVVRIYPLSLEWRLSPFPLFSAKAIGAEIWSATVNLTRNLTEALLTSLPPFWKIAKDYLDGRFKKVSLVPVSGPSTDWLLFKTSNTDNFVHL